jgi:hypothetical protein
MRARMGHFSFLSKHLDYAVSDLVAADGIEPSTLGL